MSEFSYTDIVVLSCGINDTSIQHNHYRSLWSTNLGNIVSDSLMLFLLWTLCYIQPISISIEVSIYNREMFYFSLNAEKVWFFDSHHIVAHGQNPIDTRGNGIHITHHAKKQISTVLRECITKLIRHEYTGCGHSDPCTDMLRYSWLVIFGDI